MAAGELFAQLLRGGHDQIAKLNHGRGAGLHGALARDAQLPDRFDDPVGLLRDGGGLARQRQPRCQLGVDRVALPAPAAGVRVRLVDLDDPHATAAQIAHQPSRVGAGRLDRDHVELAESAQPAQ